MTTLAAPCPQFQSIDTAALDDVAGGFTLQAPRLSSFMNGAWYGGAGGSAAGHASTFIGNVAGPMIGAAGWVIGAAAGGVVGAFDAEMNDSKQITVGQAAAYGTIGGVVANGVMGTVVEPGAGTALGAGVGLVTGGPAAAALRAAEQEVPRLWDAAKSWNGADASSATNGDDAPRLADGREAVEGATAQQDLAFDVAATQPVSADSAPTEAPIDASLATAEVTPRVGDDLSVSEAVTV